MRLCFRDPDGSVGDEFVGPDHDDLLQQWNDSGWWGSYSPDDFIVHQGFRYGLRGITADTPAEELLRKVSAAYPDYVQLDEGGAPQLPNSSGPRMLVLPQH